MKRVSLICVAVVFSWLNTMAQDQNECCKKECCKKECCKAEKKEKGTGRVIDCNQCDGKGYEKCPEAPKYCFYGDKVCPRCDGLKKIPCPDCQ